MNNTASAAAAAPAASAPVAAKSTSRRRRMLVPLAGLLAATALVVGSGADFVSSSVNPGNIYTMGTLTQTNSKSDEAIFKGADLKPGDTVNGGVKLTNSGSLPASFTLTEEAQNDFTKKSNLTLNVKDVTTGKTIYNGTLGGAGSVELGEFEAGEARDYSFDVTLAKSADNTEQGKTASASYTWDAIQADSSDD